MARRANGKQHGKAATAARHTTWTTWVGVGVTAALILGIGAVTFREGPPSKPSSSAAVAPAAAPGAETWPVVEVYKDPSCGCCSTWVAHMRADGFTVRTMETTDVASVKTAHGVPDSFWACHTALVGGYVIEGHVPASDVERLLTERPAIAGLAVPGMPAGSPGMEMPGVPAQPYNVMAFDTTGHTSVFASHQ